MSVVATTRCLEGPGLCQTLSANQMIRALNTGEARMINDDVAQVGPARQFVWNPSHKVWVRFV